MKINGIEKMSPVEINAQLQQGAKFVFFQYCISIGIMSFKRSSNIYFIPAGSSAAGKGASYCLISLLLGWWGIPWGPIWTISTVAVNLGGGTDVTSEVASSVATSAPVVRAPGAQ